MKIGIDWVMYQQDGHRCFRIGKFGIALFKPFIYFKRKNGIYFKLCNPLWLCWDLD